MIKRSLTSFLEGLVGWVISWFDQLTCSNAHKSHTCVESFYFESPYQVSSKSVEKWQSYTSFSLLGQWASCVVGWFGQFTCSNAHKSHTCVKSFYFESPYQISNKSVEKWQSYTHFSLLGWQAGWVVGWFDRINSVHMLSSSI